MSFGFCPFAMGQHVLMTCYFLESANFMGMYIFALKSIRRIPYRRILLIYGRCLRSDSLVLASYARCKPGVLGVRKHCFGLFPSNRKPILALSNVGLILLVSLRGSVGVEFPSLLLFFRLKTRHYYCKTRNSSSQGSRWIKRRPNAAASAFLKNRSRMVSSWMTMAQNIGGLLRGALCKGRGIRLLE